MEIEDMPRDIRNIAEYIGDKAAKRLCKEFGGTSIYFPTKQTPKSILRKIQKHYTGDNVNEVCRKVGVSRVTVFKYLNKKTGGEK